VIGGWALDRDRPGNSLNVDIVDGKRVIGSAAACWYRNELQFKGHDIATHGFLFTPESPIPDLGRIRVSVSGTDTYLPIALDPIPIPPNELIFAVVAGNSIPTFLATGAEDKTSIQTLLEQNGRQIRPGMRILDWGCGCARIGRHWASVSDSIEFHGCDINAQLIGWCQKHMPFGAFTISGLKPPLPYPDGHFDAIYGISVLTHLLFDTQYQWVSEIWRVLKPGGFAVLTAQGPSMLQHVSRYLQQSKTHLVDTGIFMDIEQVEEGSNSTGNIVTKDVMTKIFDPFVTLDYRPCYGLMGIQDSYVFYKNTPAYVNLTPVLLQAQMNGTAFEAEINPPVPTFGRCSFLVSATKLIYPATFEVELQFAGSALLPVRSGQHRLPEKWVWANLASASTFVHFDDVPACDGGVKLIVRCKSDRPLDGVELVIRNAFFMG
jgi:ubiquinone/menaquinone biosynthesis C-methylase UbiE